VSLMILSIRYKPF